MGSFKDVDVLRRNLQRAQGYAETAQYEASNASSEASDAEDNIRNVASVIDDIVDALEDAIGFDPHDAEVAMSNIKVVSKLLSLYIARLDGVIEGSADEYERRYALLISIINMITTTDSFGNVTWDTGYEIENEYQNGSYQYVVRQVKKEESNV